jgi:hypothetical protein
LNIFHSSSRTTRSNEVLIPCSFFKPKAVYECLNFLVSNYYPELAKYEFDVCPYSQSCPRIQKISDRKARLYLNFNDISRKDYAFIGSLAHELSHLTTNSLQEEIVDADVVRRGLGYYLALGRPWYSFPAEPFGGKGYYLGQMEIFRLHDLFFPTHKISPW